MKLSLSFLSSTTYYYVVQSNPLKWKWSPEAGKLARNPHLSEQNYGTASPSVSLKLFCLSRIFCVLLLLSSEFPLKRVRLYYSY